MLVLLGEELELGDDLGGKGLELAGGGGVDGVYGLDWCLVDLFWGLGNLDWGLEILGGSGFLELLLRLGWVGVLLVFAVLLEKLGRFLGFGRVGEIGEIIKIRHN